MLFLDFLKWWYGPGWALRLSMLAEHIKNWVEYFSVGTLLKTLFQPWRQNISRARSDQALNAKISALVDNIVSRGVGFFVRLFALTAGAIMLVLVFVFYLAVFVLWPFLPFISVIIILIGASV